MKSIDAPQDPASLFCHGFVHVVYFWLRPELSDDDRQRFEEALRRMVAESQHAVTGHIGRPAQTPREVVDNSYDFVLIVTFDDADGHQAYQEEEPHDRFRVVAAELAQRVQIYDSMG